MIYKIYLINGQRLNYNRQKNAFSFKRELLSDKENIFGQQLLKVKDYRLVIRFNFLL